LEVGATEFPTFNQHETSRAAHAGLRVCQSKGNDWVHASMMLNSIELQLPEPTGVAAG
jgi:hypothetical protein